MKRLVSLLIVFSLLACQTTMAWESFVHAKGVQDICKAFGFSDEQAIRVGDGAWSDGSDITIERKAGEKNVQMYRNQDRVFNTGVLAEGTPVKTYGKFSVSPNDTRYLNAKKYLNKAIRLAKEDKMDEACYALGVGIRSLQNIFANREAAYDAAWTAQAKIANGASAWMPGLPISPAWHNVNHDDNVFSEEKTESLKAALQATADTVGDFLAACPQAVANVKQLRTTTIDGIVEETLSLLPLKEKLTQQVKQAGQDIMSQIEKSLTAFPMPKTTEEQKKMPSPVLLVSPARWLATVAKVAFRRQLEDLKSDVEDFSGSADDEWKAFAKTTEESLAKLRKSSEDVAKALMDAAATLKAASAEEAYVVARKQLAELSSAVFATLKPHCEAEDLLTEQVAYWCDVLQKQIGEYTVSHDLSLLKIFYVLKTQLPKTDAAFADFITASNAAIKEYTGRCENALADFEQGMAAVADGYGKDAAALKANAAECVSAARAVFGEKAKQAAESLKGLAPLKQGDAIPKAVNDVIRNMLKDAKELKDNVLNNIAPNVSDSRHDDIDPFKARRLLAAHVDRQDFLRSIDIGSRRPDSWAPAVLNSEIPLEITLVKTNGRAKTPADLVEKVINHYSDAKTVQGTFDKVGDQSQHAGSKMTDETANQVVGDVGGKVASDIAGKIISKGTVKLGGKIGGALAGSRFPGGAKIGEKLGDAVATVGGEVLSHIIGPYIGEGINKVFGEGAATSLAEDIVSVSNDVNDFMEGYERAELMNNLMFGGPQGFANAMSELIGRGEMDVLDRTLNVILDGETVESQWDGLLGDFSNQVGEIVGDFNNMVDGFDNMISGIMDEFNNKFDLDSPLERPIAMEWLDQQLAPIKDFTSGIMDTISSFTLQIRGFMMGIINLAVDLEHIDISDKMNQSLQTLKSDLETMMGKDDQQDKSVKRKATIENKGRDLKRTSTKGSDLKGAPSVKQIEMKSN